MDLFLLTLFSFLIGVLATLALPFFQKRQANKWSETLKADLQKSSKALFEEKERELHLREEKLESAKLKLKGFDKEKADLERKKRELLGGDEAAVKARLLSGLEERVRKENEEHLANLRADGLKEAKTLLLSALHRVSPVEFLPSFTERVILKEDALKGRIVGPEGKNIRFLEEQLSVKLLLEKDLTITSIEPEKRFFAKLVIEALLLDGKIFPKKIEEVIAHTRLHFEGEIRTLGERAFKDLGIALPHPSISHILGKLSFRYSLGQNLLNHSKEVGEILGRLAEELHLSPHLGRRIGLLHDIGKAIVSSHESHALAGMEFLKAHGESEAVSNGVGCHHFEVEPLTAIGSLCHLADALSAGREGARADIYATRKSF